MVSLWHSSSRTYVISWGKVSLLHRYQTPIFLAVTGWWGSGEVSLLASKILSNVVVTSHSSCVFLYLFSSANISPVRFVLHLQDWWCVGKRETSFSVNKLWLIYLPPSLWPITMKNIEGICKNKNLPKLTTLIVSAWNAFAAETHIYLGLWNVISCVRRSQSRSTNSSTTFNTRLI